MPSAMSGLTARIHGRTALVVGFVALAASLALWIPATGILHPFMVDLDTYRLAAQDAHHNQSLVYKKQYGSGSKGPFLYPPFALAILMQVDSLSLHALGWALSAISAAALLATVYVLLRRLNRGWDRQTAYQTGVWWPFAITAWMVSYAGFIVSAAVVARVHRRQAGPMLVAYAFSMLVAQMASAVTIEVLSRLWDNRVPVPHTLFYVVSVVLPYHWRSGLVLAPATILIAGLLAGGRPGVGERRHLHLS